MDPALDRATIWLATHPWMTAAIICCLCVLPDLFFPVMP